MVKVYLQTLLHYVTRSQMNVRVIIVIYLYRLEWDAYVDDVGGIGLDISEKHNLIEDPIYLKNALLPTKKHSLSTEMIKVPLCDLTNAGYFLRELTHAPLAGGVT